MPVHPPRPGRPGRPDGPRPGLEHRLRADPARRRANARAGRTMDGVSLLPTIRNPSKRPQARDRDRGARAAVRGRHPQSTRGTGPTAACAPTATPTSSTRRRATQELYDRRTDPYELTTSRATRPTRRSRPTWRRSSRSSATARGRRATFRADPGRRRGRRSRWCCGRDGRAAPPARPPTSTTPATARCSSCAARRPNAKSRCGTRSGSTTALRRGGTRSTPAAIASAERGDAAVILNGPRYFLMDSARGEIGAEPDVRRPPDAPGGDDPDPAPPPSSRRRPTPSGRSCAATPGPGSRGRTVYELLAPGGADYVMQSYSQIKDPSETAATARGWARG